MGTGKLTYTSTFLFTDLRADARVVNGRWLNALAQVAAAYACWGHDSAIFSKKTRSSARICAGDSVARAYYSGQTLGAQI